MYDVRMLLVLYDELACLFDYMNSYVHLNNAFERTTMNVTFLL